MASISSDPNGRKRVLFIDGSGSRKAVRLGKLPIKTAASILTKIEALNAANVSNTPVDNETAAWLAKIGDDLHGKLAAVGLTTPRQTARLGEFLDVFIDNRRLSAAPNTITNLEQAKRRLIEHFGADRDMRSITPADADGWAAALAENYAPATAGRTIKRARQFFKLAIRDKIVTENPFVGVKASGAANKERQHHIAADIIARVKAAQNQAHLRRRIRRSNRPRRVARFRKFCRKSKRVAKICECNPSRAMLRKTT